MITSIARLAWLARPGRQARAIIAALLAAGALAAGCGTASSGSPVSSSPVSGSPVSGSPVSGSPASGPTAPSAPASPSAPATPVPTVSGGRVVAGEPACVGWPATAPSASLPVSFVPVSVERCLNGAQVIPGKGVWATATLQRADAGLAALISALRRPPATHTPGTACPAIAEIPQQVVLISGNGQRLIPRLPATGCGLTDSQVLAALDALHWAPVSVRLISEIPGTTPGKAPATIPGTTPHAIQTLAPAQPQ